MRKLVVIFATLFLGLFTACDDGYTAAIVYAKFESANKIVVTIQCNVERTDLGIEVWIDGIQDKSYRIVSQFDDKTKETITIKLNKDVPKNAFVKIIGEPYGDITTDIIIQQKKF
ncbi:hypothetical protein [Treponema zioleckii]|uniref:hypothetical protein n=1 Tax=Treponema zioleckii TaxID=331680 RepID=UPI00168B1D29|nr:hypothetical protein [Treponema zioleckii]